MDKSIYNLAATKAAKRKKRKQIKANKHQSIVMRARKALNLPEASINGLACAVVREKGWKPVDTDAKRYRMVDRFLKIKGCFYRSQEWRKVRYEALKRYGRKCVCCGAEPPYVVLHVDHIKPRSKHPELELDINNLQILCEDCNLGKSNTDEIDYR
jgi:hypothetical protein